VRSCGNEMRTSYAAISVTATESRIALRGIITVLAVDCYGCKFMRLSRSAKRGSERSGSETRSALRKKVMRYSNS
jgi:hypothetical protein